jgi:competence ComEA-like helix-hairpin-helix protein
VSFRDKLGGFYSVDQVGETFALPDSTFQKIRQYLKIETISIKKININTATIDELKGHPYIRWSIANPIIAYRNEHGAFSKPEDLKKIVAVTDELFNKIAPYLSTQ